ncbi:MAG: hypothetical protein IPL59_03985 [Candidatus Competibacteraceae bacterium]|uniref:hypothetical protein n=1 Tax=Candidatus Contendibacter odensensis TaxID=1400860 RepID=UPI0004AE50F3|nr:hypothetical protein [Candidatus Contendobacter odensis]MBK8534343.1 hypothetical protein [Candidatus Competibacteraceae bacterium]
MIFSNELSRPARDHAATPDLCESCYHTLTRHLLVEGIFFGATGRNSRDYPG